jgi:hypothetical protein
MHARQRVVLSFHFDSAHVHARYHLHIYRSCYLEKLIKTHVNRDVHVSAACIFLRIIVPEKIGSRKFSLVRVYIWRIRALYLFKIPVTSQFIFQLNDDNQKETDRV